MTNWYGDCLTFNEATFHSNFTSLFLVMVGAIVLIIGIVGFIAYATGSMFLVMFYSICVGYIVILEVIVCSSVFLRINTIEERSVRLLKEGIVHYDEKNSTASDCLDLLQSTYSCCGQYGVEDYERREKGIPGTCCEKPQNESCVVWETSNRNGCHDQEVKVLEIATRSIGTSTCVIAFVHLLAIVISCRRLVKDANAHLIQDDD